jgi:hypothetical protein
MPHPRSLTDYIKKRKRGKGPTKGLEAIARRISYWVLRLWCVRTYAENNACFYWEFKSRVPFLKDDEHAGTVAVPHLHITVFSRAWRSLRYAATYCHVQLLRSWTLIYRFAFCLKCRPVYVSKHNVSETGFCLRPQVKPTLSFQQTELVPISGHLCHFKMEYINPNTTLHQWELRKLLNYDAPHV